MQAMDPPQLLQVSQHDMGFCPGCSHARVLEGLSRVLQRLSLRAEQVCLVSDIGCIGISDRYFSCHTFHGLHGRSVTYAEGIKRARPDLTVVVLIGDGGCGIGTGHLVHAARRDVDITVLACNNFNFGMTGGQHSPTTPPCGLTVTTPGGATEHVFDICTTVAGNGGSYVARCSAYDSDLDDRIETAIRTPGFALLDIWELCVAYYVGANKLNPRSLTDLSNRLNLPFAVLADRPKSPVESTPDGPSPLPLPNPRQDAADAGSAGLTWRGRREIVVAGSAGQRVRSACGVLGELVCRGGSHAAQLDDFPITVRKGFSVSNLVLSESPIRYAAVDHPDLIVLLSGDGYMRVRKAPFGQQVALYAEESLPLDENVKTLRRFSLREVEKTAGKAGVALSILCQGVIEQGWASGERLLESARGSLRGAHKDDQLRAIEAAVNAAVQSRGGES